MERRRELVGYMQQTVEGHPDPVHVLGIGPELPDDPRPDPHRQGRVLLRQIQEQLVQGSDRPLVLVGDFDGQREILLHRLGVQEAVVEGQVPGGHAAALHQESPPLDFPLAGAGRGDIPLAVLQVYQVAGGVVGPLAGVVLPADALLREPVLPAFHGESQIGHGPLRLLLGIVPHILVVFLQVVPDIVVLVQAVL